MNSKKTIVGLAVFSLAILAGATSVSAYQGNFAQKGPNYSPERHEAIETAFENKDYNAWQEQMLGRGRVANVINEENFAQFAEARRLAMQGDIEGADAIRAELGLRTSNGEKLGMGHRGGQDGQKGQRRGMGMRGAGQGQGFVDANGDGVCDNLK